VQPVGESESVVESVDVEASDGLDPVIGNREHDQSRRGGDWLGAVAEVTAEGGLGVGVGEH
jgi:hypothetical protein